MTKQPMDEQVLRARARMSRLARSHPNFFTEYAQFKEAETAYVNAKAKYEQTKAVWETFLNPAD